MNKVIISLIIFSFGFSCADRLSDAITSVPGFIGTLPFKAYAGYLPANDGDKMMFYWFSESQNDPSTDPVVLWLNGGPGCSSFDGFVYEHGPFTFNNGPDGAKQNLTLNPYSWTKVANMIYLDSPCGVGLSYSNNSNDYITDDVITAMDSHNFLLNFFTAYPEFQSNDFYVSGESYAGVYVPTLAQQVMYGIHNGTTPKINLKGILVGNGVTDEVFDGNAWIPFIYGHSFISNELMADIEESCDGNYWNPSNNECDNLLGNASNLVEDLNIYDVLINCYMGESDTRFQDLMTRVTTKLRQTTKDFSDNDGEQVPCIDSNRATAWLNTPSVRTALHAIPVSVQNWTICSDLISYTSTYSTVIPIHEELLENGYRIMIYSGDSDMCVPNTGSEAWTESLNLPIIDLWRPWFVNNQVAGYTQGYKGLTYATIKGAGHMVPQFKPPQALHFFTQFLNGQPL